LERFRGEKGVKFREKVGENGVSEAGVRLGGVGIRGASLKEEDSSKMVLREEKFLGLQKEEVWGD